MSHPLSPAMRAALDLSVRGRLRSFRRGFAFSKRDFASGAFVGRKTLSALISRGLMREPWLQGGSGLIVTEITPKGLAHD